MAWPAETVISAGQARRRVADLVAFWASLAAIGVGLVALRGAEVNLGGYGLRPGPWTFAHGLAATVVIALAVLGLLLMVPRGGSLAGREVGWPMFGAVAPGLVAPVAAVLLVLGATWFVLLPAAAAGCGWAAARVWAGRGGSVGRWSDKKVLATVVLASAGCAAVWFVQAQRAWEAGHLGGPDVASFALRLHNTLSGRFWLAENGLARPFADHFNPGFYMLLPLYGLWPSLGLLNLVQAVCLAGTAVVLYVVGRRVGLAADVAGMAALAWLLLPNVSQMAYGFSYGFHAVSLALPVFAGSLIGLAGRRWVMFGLLAALACSFRETVALSYVGLGLWMVSRRGLRRAGAITCAAAGGWLVVVVLVIVPAIAGGRYVGYGKFSQLGEGIGQIVASPILRPGAFWGSVFSRASLLFVVVTVLVAGVVPLLRGGGRLLALLGEGPALLLWNDPHVKNICFQYQAVLLVVLWWVMIGGLKRLGGAGGRRWALGGLVSCGVGSLLLGRMPWSGATLAFDRFADRRDVIEWASRQVGPGDRVAATPRVAGHLLFCQEVWTWPFDAGHAGLPEVLVLDYGDDWLREDVGRAVGALWRAQRQAMRRGWRVVGEYAGAVVLRRGARAGMSLPFVEVLPAGLRGVARSLPGRMRLLGWRFEPVAGQRAGGRLVGLRYWLQAETGWRPNVAVAAELRDMRLGGLVVADSADRPVGLRLPPGVGWRAGQIIEQADVLVWRGPLPFAPDSVRLTVRVVELDGGGG